MIRPNWTSCLVYNNAKYFVVTVVKRMKKIQKKDGDKMPMIIEEIVRVQRQDSDAFIKIQQKRLIQLREIEQRKQNGKKIQTGRIVRNLQSSGILDANGNLSKKYSD